MTLLDWAKHYVYHFGFSVLPLAHREKTPLCSWKIYQQRKMNETELARWFHRQDRNIGVITGVISRSLCVIDFDDKEAYKEWKGRGRKRLFQTVTTGKGVHVYVFCRHAKTGNAYHKGKHIGEIRYNGGYVVAPPSLHPSGHVYHWQPGIWARIDALDDIDIEVKAGRSEQTNVRQKEIKKSPPVTLSHVKNQEAYCQAALRGEVQKILQAKGGERNNTLFRAGIKLCKYSPVLGRDNISEALKHAALRAGLPETETIKTLQSSLSGKY